MNSIKSDKKEKKEINPLLLNLIITSFKKKTILTKLNHINNKQIKSFYYSNLVSYEGTWREFWPQDGRGVFTIGDCISEGIWENGKGKGIIYKTNNKTIIKKGEWDHFIIDNEGEYLIDAEMKEGFIKYNKPIDKIFNFLDHKEFLEKEKSFKGILMINNRVYQGVWEDNIGRGIIISYLDNQEYIFTGSWRDNIIIEGEGIVVEDDNKYIGVWAKEGNRGRIESKNGQIFFGTWDNYFWPTNGEGVFVISSKIIYKGKWENEIGLREVFSGKDCVYKGTWNKYGHFLSGEGSLYNFDGNKFDGVWSNDDNSNIGKGTITFQNGHKIEAEWDNFRRITKGKGIYYDKLERKYVGEISEGNGTGKIISLNGLEYVGSWDVDGFPVDGEGIFVLEGVIFKGIWEFSVGKGVIYS